MNENKHLHQAHGNFWSGFYMGTILGAGGLFLLGTKKGRETLQKILDATENLEESVVNILDELHKEVNNEKASSTVEMITSHLPTGENLNALTTRIRRVFSPSQMGKKSLKRKK